MIQTAEFNQDFISQFKTAEQSLRSTRSKIVNTQELYKSISGSERSTSRWVIYLISRVIYGIAVLFTLLLVVFNSHFLFVFVYFIVPLLLLGPVGGRIIVPWLLGLLSNKLEKLTLQLRNSKAEFDKLVELYLLPEVHRMGMATTQNVLDKTIASILHKDTVAEILEDQVGCGDMQRVPLNSGEVLYKSLLSRCDDSTVEKVTLNLDDDELVFVTYSSDSSAEPHINQIESEFASGPAAHSIVDQANYELSEPSSSEAPKIRETNISTNALESTSTASIALNSSNSNLVISGPMPLQVAQINKTTMKPKTSLVVVFGVLASVVIGGTGYWGWTQKVAADEQGVLLMKAKIEDQLRKAEEEKRLKLEQEQAQKEADEKARLEVAEKEKEEAMKAVHEPAQLQEPPSLNPVDAAPKGKSIDTRFGTLQIDEQNELLYLGHSLIPPIRGNNSLTPIGVYAIGNADVLLIQDNGGMACPAMYYFVSVSASGVKSTPEFGTCSDLIKVQQIYDKISITMPEFIGPMESRVDPIGPNRTTRQKPVFTYEDTMLKKNGRLVK